MKTKTVNSQLYNFKTYLNYKDKMMALALNVFQFNNIDPFIDMAKVNYSLLCDGSVAFFKDDVTNRLLAMPYTSVGSLDMYGRPQAIRPIPYYGTYNRTLYKRKNEFVIMHDNEAKIPLLPNIIASAERLALIKRTIDINISQQCTNRVWTVPEDKELTLKKLLEQVDSKVETILTYDGLDINNINSVINVAPYVADKLNDAKKEEWAEFLEMIGITSNALNKKERVIVDEVFTSMGGVIASRYNRYEARRKAVAEINKYFGTNIEVSFYDGLPATIKDPDEFLGVPETKENEEGGDINAISTISNAI